MPGSLVIVNPRASWTRAGDTRAALRSALDEALLRRDGVPPRIVETTSADEVRPLAADALREGVASMVGVGGDGTMRDIAAVLAGTRIPLGIIPAGTGNQVAAVLGIPRAPDAAVVALADTQPRAIDLGEVTVHAPDGGEATSMFIIGCGAGFDAELMATTSVALKQRLGTVAYFFQGARLAMRVKAVPCHLTIDERVLEMPVTTALVGNMGQLVPGRLGLRLPLDPADGLLDLIAVEARDPVRGALALLDQLRRTQLGGEPGGRSLRLRGRRVAIEPLEPMPLEIDGDHIGEGGFSARVLPGALRVLVPRA